MAKIALNQRGSSHLIAILAVVAVVVVAGVGYRVYSQRNSAAPATTAAASTQPAQVPAQIRNKADLRQASQALDNSADQSGSNPNQLDSDLNSLL